MPSEYGNGMHNPINIDCSALHKHSGWKKKVKEKSTHTHTHIVGEGLLRNSSLWSIPLSNFELILMARHQRIQKINYV